MRNRRHVLSVKSVFLRRIPWVQKKISEELGKTMSELKRDVDSQLRGLPYLTQLPDQGWDRDRIVAEVDMLQIL